MNTMIGTDLDAISRTRALAYGVDQLLRARSAIAHASHDEPRVQRRQILQSITDRLSVMLHELKALS